MDTTTIGHRVADFLQKHPPFQGMEDADLLGLAGRGRVRFHERHEHIMWQGESHKPFVFVIQQGVVTLWDEVDGAYELRDVRGAGDLLGVERFNGAPNCLHSARAATDVVLYAFPTEDIAALLDRYPHAERYVAAYSAVTLDAHGTGGRRQPEAMFLHELAKTKRPITCNAGDSLRDVARAMRSQRVDAIVVIDADRRPRGVITTGDLIGWIAGGAGNGEQPVGSLLNGPLLTVSPDASVADGVLAMGTSGSPALAITDDGTSKGGLQALVTAADLAPAFGDQPVQILRELRGASGTSELRALNHRARAFALHQLVNAHSVDWLARFTTEVDIAIVRRAIALAGAEYDTCSWALWGASGRGESLPRVTPGLVLLSDRSDAPALHRRVADQLGECDYLPVPVPFDASFEAANAVEWRERYLAWVRDPVRSQMYRARSLFDLRPIHGPEAPWHEIERALYGAVGTDFLRLLANDCLASLPPLTFFQDNVVDELGAHNPLFHLERSALIPIVDVARVFGMAAGRWLGGSTHERFLLARRMLPAHDALFREASDTFSVLLWQQGRIGIAQGTSGAELPASLLGRQDRQVLKGGFRVILRLIELTAGWTWLDA